MFLLFTTFYGNLPRYHWRMAFIVAEIVVGSVNTVLSNMSVNLSWVRKHNYPFWTNCRWIFPMFLKSTIWQQCILVGCVLSDAVAVGGEGIWPGVSARGGCLPGGVCLGGWLRGECLPQCMLRYTHPQCTPPVNRMTDRHLWKYYLATTSLRTVKIAPSRTDYRSRYNKKLSPKLFSKLYQNPLALTLLCTSSFLFKANGNSTYVLNGYFTFTAVKHMPDSNKVLTTFSFLFL